MTGCFDFSFCLLRRNFAIKVFIVVKDHHGYRLCFIGLVIYAFEAADSICHGFVFLFKDDDVLFERGDGLNIFTEFWFDVVDYLDFVDVGTFVTRKLCVFSTGIHILEEVALCLNT